ncbi:MAG: glutathione S-transferase family protein [Gammaproteobacteria bacterium]|nr:glutathione S-transferase family protein [Gammaproteobacteria bacterium]
MSEKLVFYTNPMSRGQIARWMLEETGAEYEQVIIEYGEQMKSVAYLTINPMGKVPAIQHGDHVVTECAAICAYLADAFPQQQLAPPKSERADYYRWLFFAAGPLEAAITNRSLGVKVPDDQERMAGYGNYDLTISVLRDLFASRNFVCGDEFSAADVYLGSHIDFGMQFGTLEANPEFEAYAARFRERPAYIKARQIDGELIAAAQQS